MNAYRWNAKDYEKNSQAQLKWAKELIAKLRLKGNEHVLDLGCGDGKITAEIARLLENGYCIGVDSSTSMIETARENFPKIQYPNLSFMIMDARYLDFNHCFDVVFSNATLHWVKRHGPVLISLHKYLKPGGRLLMQMGGKGNACGVLSTLDEMLLEDEWKPYFINFEFPYQFYSDKEYEQLLEKAGFISKRINLIPKDMVQDGHRGLEGWIRTTWLPYTERLPEKKRDQFIEELTRKYIERYPLDNNGKVHVAMTRLEVEAKKFG